MHILTTASTVSEIWDDAPSMFHIELSDSDRAKIIQAHKLAQVMDDICNIDLTMHGQTWCNSYEVYDLEYESGMTMINDEEEKAIMLTDERMPEIVEAMERNEARMECMHVSVWQHGSIQFSATPKHCGDDMICYSASLTIEDIEKGEIYIDGV